MQSRKFKGFSPIVELGNITITLRRSPYGISE
jgi:hypothetical protein